MIEANPVKFYVAKYFFLAFAFIQMLAALALVTQFGLTNKVFFVSLLFITMSTIFFAMFIVVTQKVRRVAIGKNKIVVIEGDRNMRFSWPEVKSLKIIPFFNLYKLKIRGKKKSIYFFPSKNIDPAFGLLAKDTSKMGSIVEKRKKELGFE
jgi:hypothetical protein